MAGGGGGDTPETPRGWSRGCRGRHCDTGAGRVLLKTFGLCLNVSSRGCDSHKRHVALT